jgi:hypothetical protein
MALGATKFESRNPKFETNSKHKNFNVRNKNAAAYGFGHLNLDHLTLFRPALARHARFTYVFSQRRDSRSQRRVRGRRVWARDFVLRISDFQLLCVVQRSCGLGYYSHRASLRPETRVVRRPTASRKTLSCPHTSTPCLARVMPV